MTAGRKSDYTEALADIICARLIDGESLTKICRDVTMPCRTTVLNWIDERPEFRAECARARELQGDTMADKIMDLIENTTAENAHASKVQLSGLQWVASKLAPKKYGDKQAVAHSGPDGGPMQHESTVVILPSNGRE
jgi:hypothetical protein